MSLICISRVPLIINPGSTTMTTANVQGRKSFSARGKSSLSHSILYSLSTPLVAQFAPLPPSNFCNQIDGVVGAPKMVERSKRAEIGKKERKKGNGFETTLCSRDYSRAN